jgi:hypothetical protein
MDEGYAAMQGGGGLPDFLQNNFLLYYFLKSVDGNLTGRCVK